MRGRLEDWAPGRVVLVAAALAGLVVVAAPAAATAAPAKVAKRLRTASAPASELKQTRTVPLPGGATLYRFQQRVSGVKVLGGEAVVNDATGAPPRLAADSTRPSVDAPRAPRLTERSAIGIASRATGIQRLRGRPSAKLAIQPGEGGTLVWRAVIPSARPLGDFEVLVDASSGEVLSKRNMVRDFRTGHAKLYDPNPIVEHGSFNGLKRDHNDQDTPLLTSLRMPVKLRDIRSGQHCLRGRWAHVVLGHKKKEVCKPSLRWNGVKRSKAAFEALMTYFHIDRAQRYIQHLGFRKARGSGVNQRSQVGIADAFSQDNDFYSPVDRKIRYGVGGVDDDEDADVILHEYGHAMQDSEAHGFLSSNGFQAGALAEGSADYWAAAMSSRSPGTNNVDDVCIFDWDGTSWGPIVPPFHRHCGRRADDGRTLQQALNNLSCSQDIHCVGQVWSSALWDLRKEIGGQSFDKVYLAGQFFYTAGERFSDAAQALLQADQDLNGGAHHALICNEMETNRGLTVSGCP